MPHDGVDSDRGWILANAERFLRLLMTLPGWRDDAALAVVNGFFASTRRSGIHIGYRHDLAVENRCPDA